MDSKEYFRIFLYQLCEEESEGNCPECLWMPFSEWEQRWSEGGLWWQRRSEVSTPVHLWTLLQLPCQPASSLSLEDWTLLQCAEESASSCWESSDLLPSEGRLPLSACSSLTLQSEGLKVFQSCLRGPKRRPFGPRSTWRWRFHPFPAQRRCRWGPRRRGLGDSETLWNSWRVLSLDTSWSGGRNLWKWISQGRSELPQRLSSYVNSWRRKSSGK